MIKSRFNFLQKDILFSIQYKPELPKNWKQLATQVDVFYAPKMNTNIQNAEQALTLHCNSGKDVLSQKDDIKDTVKSGSSLMGSGTSFP